MIKFSKQQIVFAAGVLIVSIGLALVIVNSRQKPRYVAVRLQTGELYFGKISWFPAPRLSNVWFVQVEQDGNVTLDRFGNLVWQPQEPLKISRDKIVFWTYLNPASPVVQAIEGRIQAVPRQPGALIPGGDLGVSPLAEPKQ